MGIFKQKGSQFSNTLLRTMHIEIQLQVHEIAGYPDVSDLVEL